MNAKLTTLAARQGSVFSRAQAMRCGYTPREISRRLADGRWLRIRRGQYAEAIDLGDLAPWERLRQQHLRQVHAAVNSVAPGSAAVSHQSALVLHGAPVWGLDLSEVQFTRMDDQRSGLVAGIRHHRGLLDPADLTEADGLIVTTPARSLVETACTSPLEPAIVSADAIRREYPDIDDELTRLLEVSRFWPGSTTARAAIAFSSRASESVGETRLRVLMDHQGLPAPLLQVPFHDELGLIGRVDFYFPAEKTVVEFDGLLKYATGDAGILVQEKQREDRLRARGLEVVRLTWADLARADPTAATIRRAFARSHSRRAA